MWSHQRVFTDLPLLSYCSSVERLCHTLHDLWNSEQDSQMKGEVDGCCSIYIPPNLHFKLKICEILFVLNIHIKSLIIFKFCTHTAALLQCTVQDLKKSEQPRNKLWANAILQDFEFNTLWPGDTIWLHRSGSTPAQIILGLLPDSTKPLPDPMLTYHQ